MKPKPCAPQLWTDIYGSVRANYEFGPGGQRWLVAAALRPKSAAGTPPHESPASALDVASSLEQHLMSLSPRLKGEVHLLLHVGLTPLQAAAREVQPLGALVIGKVAASGPALSVPQETVRASSGLSYREGGEFPAWRAAFVLPGAGAGGPHPAASACAALGLGVVVCSPAHLGAALQGWAASVPHGLRYA